MARKCPLVIPCSAQGVNIVKIKGYRSFCKGFVIVKRRSDSDGVCDFWVEVLNDVLKPQQHG